jgi:16S rRNA (guanine527-N7)-methyltransferase
MSRRPLPTSVERRLSELAERYGLSAEAIAGLGGFLALLETDPLAPTTIRAPAVAVDQHVADALVAVELGCFEEPVAVADLGAGAGVPGLVLALARPQLRVTLVESNARKCAFLGRAVAASGAGNVTVVNDRAETWTDGFSIQDVVTARAVAPLPVLAEYAAPLLVLGGQLVAWTGRREVEVEAEAYRAAEILAMSGPMSVDVHPFPGAEHRHLHLMSKLSPTPEAFPRRPGTARKRPLGGAQRASDRDRR